MSECFTVYKQALKQRRQYPLRSGAYKLREAALSLNRYKQEIELLAECLHCKRPLRGLSTYGDHAPWLKKTPQDIADMLGYIVLPAIQKLNADGVSEPVLSQKLPWFEQEIINIVNECDTTSAVMKCGIKHEYNRWKSGESALLPVIHRAQDLVETARSLVHQSQSDKTGSGNSDHNAHYSMR